MSWCPSSFLDHPSLAFCCGALRTTVYLMKSTIAELVWRTVEDPYPRVRGLDIRDRIDLEDWQGDNVGLHVERKSCDTVSLS